MKGAPSDDGEILKREEALMLEATEHNLELERLETRERQVAQAEDAVSAPEARAQEEVDRRVAEARADLAGRYDLKLKLVEAEGVGKNVPSCSLFNSGLSAPSPSCSKAGRRHFSVRRCSASMLPCFSRSGGGPT